MNVVLDFETYFDSEYSLRKLTTSLYVRDPQFKVFGVGIKIDDRPAEWIQADHIEQRLGMLPWHIITLVGHNLLFDGLILVERYGIKPLYWADTMGMARAFLPSGSKSSLNECARLMGLDTKIEGTLDSLKGVRDPTPEQLNALGEYCIRDVNITAGLFNRWYQLMPRDERGILHMTTRMGVECSVELDKTVLDQEIEIAKTTKSEKIGGYDAEQLSSNVKFAALLEDLTGEVPKKLNAKNEEIPALGKTDAAWVQFKLNHPELESLCEAREAVKSNIRLRRAQLFRRIADTGKLPMPYRYYGAHTGRFSGADGLNVQNLPNLHRSNLRRALRAPEGHVIHVADSAQIELRLQLWFTSQFNELKLLAEGGDLYKTTAAAIYNKPVDQVTKLERAVGKATLLGSQYGMGAKKYRAYMAGGPLGMDPIFFSQEEAEHIIRVFRGRYKPTVQMWHLLDDHIGAMANPKAAVPLGPISVRHEHIVLPNGMPIDYSGLRYTEEGSWVYGNNKFLWGGTMLENLCQGLGRVILTEQALKIDQEVVRVIGWTHDEILCIGPESHAEVHQDTIERIMSLPTSWAPDLPLGAEGGFSRVYEK